MHWQLAHAIVAVEFNRADRFSPMVTAMNADSPDDPGIRFPPPLIFLGLILAGVAIDAATRLRFPPLPDWLRWGVAATLAGAGVLLAASALRRFHVLGTRPEPWQPSSSLKWVGGRLRFRGEASAAPEREAALVNLLNIIGRRSGARSLIAIG